MSVGVQTALASSEGSTAVGRNREGGGGTGAAEINTAGVARIDRDSDVVEAFPAAKRVRDLRCESRAAVDRPIDFAVPFACRRKDCGHRANVVDRQLDSIRTSH